MKQPVNLSSLQLGTALVEFHEGACGITGRAEISEDYANLWGTPEELGLAVGRLIEDLEKIREFTRGLSQ